MLALLDLSPPLDVINHVAVIDRLGNRGLFSGTVSAFPTRNSFVLCFFLDMQDMHHILFYLKCISYYLLSSVRVDDILTRQTARFLL